ncbi:MAG: replicative DNA helicase, partial [Burkholderiales bacterium]
LVTGSFGRKEKKRIASVTGAKNHPPLFLKTCAHLSVMEIRALARLAKSEFGGLALIVIDYLQLMNGHRDFDGIEQRPDICADLKALANELGVPVIAVSQLNNAVDLRPDKRPIVADLQDFGTLEQDADMIIFIYRDEVYNPDTEGKGMAEIIMAKHPNRPHGTSRLEFHPEYALFREIEGANKWPQLERLL